LFFAETTALHSTHQYFPTSLVFELSEETVSSSGADLVARLTPYDKCMTLPNKQARFRAQRLVTMADPTPLAAK
jgi:hypothetical protein